MVANPGYGVGKFADPNVAVTESGGMLEVSLSSNVIGYGAYMSNVSFDLVEDAIVVQITSPPSVQRPARRPICAPRPTPTTASMFWFKAASVSFRRQVDSTILPPRDDAVFGEHLNWVRIRETGE